MGKMFSEDLESKGLLMCCPNYETSKDDGKSQYIIDKEKRADMEVI